MNRTIGKATNNEPENSNKYTQNKILRKDHDSDERLEAPGDNSATVPMSSFTVAAALHSDVGRDSTESLDEMQRNANDGDGKEMLTTDVVAVRLHVQ